MSGLAFRPVSIIGGLLGGLIAAKLFEFAWGRFADEEAPEPGHREIAWPQLVVALVVEGALFRLIRGLIDRGTRVAFVRATGSWPGEEKPEKK
jgi:hypothetical protein